MSAEFNNYDKAEHARMLYRRGEISKAEAMEIMADFIEEFNEKAKSLAKKYNQKPKLFNFRAFMR